MDWIDVLHLLSVTDQADKHYLLRSSPTKVKFLLFNKAPCIFCSRECLTSKKICMALAASQDEDYNQIVELVMSIIVIAKTTFWTGDQKNFFKINSKVSLFMSA